jgi:hypothetical protein
MVDYRGEIVTRRADGTVRRGDNIPPVSDYAQYNEFAQQVWYQENKYDMEHADEIVEYYDDDRLPSDDD